MKYKYILEQYKGINTRYTCPQCGKQRKFSRYTDSITGEYIAEHVGRCDRQDNCGYHYTPKQYFEDKGISIDSSAFNHFQEKVQATPPKPISTIPTNIFWQSMQHGKSIEEIADANLFVRFLLNRFGEKTAFCLTYDYFVGTSKDGKVVFWQIDVKERIRTGKIMLYSSTTGKRSKEILPTWVHSILKSPDFNMKQCFFGEHHLQLFPDKIVAVVESEKTAIIASLYLPQFIWLASGGANGLTNEKFEVLKGRNVILYPDISKPKLGEKTAFEKWSKRAKELSHIAHIEVSELLEQKASDEEREQGLDLADYLLRFEPQDFCNH